MELAVIPEHLAGVDIRPLAGSAVPLVPEEFQDLVEAVEGVGVGFSGYSGPSLMSFRSS